MSKLAARISRKAGFPTGPVTDQDQITHAVACIAFRRWLEYSIYVTDRRKGVWERD